MIPQCGHVLASLLRRRLSVRHTGFISRNRRGHVTVTSQSAHRQRSTAPGVSRRRRRRHISLSRNDPMHDSVSYPRNTLSHETDILHEYFIPRDRFVQIRRRLARDRHVGARPAAQRLGPRRSPRRQRPDVCAGRRHAGGRSLRQPVDRSHRPRADGRVHQVGDRPVPSGQWALLSAVSGRLHASAAGTVVPTDPRIPRRARRVRSGPRADEHVRGNDRSAAWSMSRAKASTAIAPNQSRTLDLPGPPSTAITVGPSRSGPDPGLAAPTTSR
jgi:hypothetical protein